MRKQQPTSGELNHRLVRAAFIFKPGARPTNTPNRSSALRSNCMVPVKSKIMIKNGAHGLQLFPGFGACSVFGTSSLFSTTGEPLRSLNNPELATLSPAFNPFSTVM